MFFSEPLAIDAGHEIVGIQHAAYDFDFPPAMGMGFHRCVARVGVMMGMAFLVVAGPDGIDSV